MQTTRRFTRLFLALLACASLGACHFHGCGHWAHCSTVRYCR
jgi:hypothetical protein